MVPENFHTNRFKETHKTEDAVSLWNVSGTVTGTVAKTEGIQEGVYNVIREELEPESTSLAEMPAGRKKVKEVLSKLQNLIQGTFVATQIRV